MNSVFAHEDTNNFIFTKYLLFLFEIITLCADTEYYLHLVFDSNVLIKCKKGNEHKEGKIRMKKFTKEFIQKQS
jgi:hypothetical protein